MNIKMFNNDVPRRQRHLTISANPVGRLGDARRAALDGYAATSSRLQIAQCFTQTNKVKRSPKAPPPDEVIRKMRMVSQVYESIKQTIGSESPETGGMLLSKSQDYTITKFVFDTAACRSMTVYQPNTSFLNKALIGRNNEFVGIVHSHPAGFSDLTTQDKQAAWSNLTSPSNPHLQAYLMPLVQTIPDTGRFEIIPYIVTCHPRGRGEVIVKRVPLEVV